VTGARSALGRWIVAVTVGEAVAAAVAVVATISELETPSSAFS
jgi:hypothetical protein